MRIESSLSSQVATPRRHFWLQSLLLVGFVICLVIGLVALGTLWWLYRAPAVLSPVNTMLPTLQTEQIVPQLALMQLAGDSSEALAYQALNAGELETSRALVWVGIDQMSSARIALILKLAQHFAQDGQTQSAQALYQQARALAILDMSLTPLERSQALLRCVTGLLELDQSAAALDAAQQIVLIVQHAPDLLPAQRSQMLRDLQKATPAFHDTDFGKTLNEFVRNPYISPTTTLLRGQWPALAEDPPLDPNMAAVTNERHLAARRLAERLLQVQPTEAEPERQLLVRALLIEDQQRTAYFTQNSTAQSLTFSVQFWLLQQQHTWLLVKLAVAQRAYGIALVPEWEAAQATILQELATVTSNLHQALLALAQTQSTPDEQLVQRFYAHSWLAQQVEFGLYPAQNALEIGEQFRVLQGDLRAQGITPALPIAYLGDAVPPGFRIVAALSQ